MAKQKRSKQRLCRNESSYRAYIHHHQQVRRRKQSTKQVHFAPVRPIVHMLVDHCGLWYTRAELALMEERDDLLLLLWQRQTLTTNEHCARGLTDALRWHADVDAHYSGRMLDRQYHGVQEMAKACRLHSQESKYLAFVRGMSDASYVHAILSEE